MKCLRCLPVLLLAGCLQHESRQKTPVLSDTLLHKDSSQAAFVLTGERTSGTVTVHDSIGGPAIFTLFNNTLVQCAPATAGWYPVAAEADVPLQAIKNGQTRLVKGQKIFNKGHITGEMQRDTTVYPSMKNDSVASVLLYGYVPVHAIQPGSVIENALSDYLSQHPAISYRLENMQAFINNFALQQGQLVPGFVHYYNYENSIEDPSPLFRMVLVFRENRLTGIIHARPMKAPAGTHRYQLQRDFTADFYSTADKKMLNDYIHRFNQFISSVD